MENQNQNEDQNFQAPTLAQGKSSVWKIVVGVVVVVGLAAAAYFLGAGDLFKGQIKLSAEEKCKKTFETYMEDQKKTGIFKRCESLYPDMLKSLQEAGNTQVVVEEPKVVEQPKGFVFDSFKIDNMMYPAGIDDYVVYNPYPNYDDSLDGIEDDSKKIAKINFTFPTYTDPEMPPVIALTAKLELCSDVARKCATVAQQSVNLGQGETPSSGGAIDFTAGDLFNAVKNIGGKEKFPSVKKGPYTGAVDIYEGALNVAIMNLDGKFVNTKKLYKIVFRVFSKEDLADADAAAAEGGEAAELDPNSTTSYGQF